MIRIIEFPCCILYDLRKRLIVNMAYIREQMMFDLKVQSPQKESEHLIIHGKI